MKGTSAAFLTGEDFWSPNFPPAYQCFRVISGTSWMRNGKIGKLPTGVDILTAHWCVTEVLQVGDVGSHGGWEPLILFSPLSPCLQHFQLCRGEAMAPAELQLRTSRQDSIHNTAWCRMVLVWLDSRHLITRHVLGAGEVLVGRLDVFHAAFAEFWGLTTEPF